MKRALVCGSGGFIGGHLTKRLKEEGYWIRGIDLKEHEYGNDHSDESIIGDLRQSDICNKAVQGIDIVFQLAADMGGAGYLFTGDNDADVMHNSALINLNILDLCRRNNVRKVFYSSSACVYPEYNQENLNSPICTEDTVYPAQPDSEYGWEKLFSERLYLSYAKNYGIDVKIARFHNIFGPKGTWDGGREKAPAAICRKVALAKDGGQIEIWGDGLQTRSFLYVDECIEGIWRLVNSEFSGPVNIGSDRLLSINRFSKIVIEIAGKDLTLQHVDGPLGVRGRNSDNTLIQKRIGWAPQESLEVGLRKTFQWINEQIK